MRAYRAAQRDAAIPWQHPRYTGAMVTARLATKLYIPPQRPNVVLRPRLIAQLNEGLHRKLTLIAAPAGFGKTTLISTWLAACARPVAWLSLDEGERDLTRFLTYLVAALQTIVPTIGAGVLGALESSPPPPQEAILTALLNDIAATPDPFVLVLDDYHLVDARAVDTALAFLLDHLPAQMHLMITTREDPHFPLARLRVRDQLTELRAADLRFTPPEAAAFLSQVMDLHLSAEDVAALERRTEGWIAGLQLAALSMRGRADIGQFVRAFAGDNRYIVDYLVEEVLQRQPERVRNFLLQTSILDRLNGPLCDAVLDERPEMQHDSTTPFALRPASRILEELERGNFFVVPLDDQRQWYRYHHLFAEVLATHLRAEQPEQVATLHRRASAWYAENGVPADAIRHALAAKDFARAADLVELAVPAMSQSRQETTLLSWFKALPEPLVRTRPVLSVYYAGTLLLSGQIEGVESRLQDAERWLGAQSGADTAMPQEALLATTRGHPTVMDEAELRSLRAGIALYRAASALALGNVANTIQFAQQTLDLAPADDHLRRGAAAGLLGLAYWTDGALAAAYQSYTECMVRLQQAGHIADTLGCAIALADIRMTQGRLRDAMSIYAQAMQVATPPDRPTLRGAADMHVGMSVLLYEGNDLAASLQHLLASKALGEHLGLPQNRYRWCVAMARIRKAEGDLDGTLDLLDQAAHLYASDLFPNVHPVVARKARVWLAQGRLDEALGWVREQGLSAQDELTYLHEFEHITLARILLAQQTKSSLAEAIGLIERLLRAAEAGERTGSVIEILVLQALTHHMHGEIPAALAALQRALTLAEPEGYVRMFVDEGALMVALLQEALAYGILPGSVEQLLNAFPKADTETWRHGDTEMDRGSVTQVSRSPGLPASQSLIEPLSDRERDVLRLLRTDLSGPQIAQELIVSLSTIRTHTRNIYAKLGVANRRAAVRRAEELGLL